MEVIRSRDNPLIKDLRRLSQDGAAYRKTGKILIEGEHLCQAALAQGVQPISELFSESKYAKLPVDYAGAAPKKIVIADMLWAEISALESPAGQAYVLPHPLVHPHPNTLAEPPSASNPIQAKVKTLVLDRLQDPGNVGSILRSCAAFGYAQVIALKGTVALWSPKVLRAAMGAHFSLHLIETASVQDLQNLARPLAVTSSHHGQYLHELLQNKELLPQVLKAHSSELSIKNEDFLALHDLNWALGHEGQGVCEPLQQKAAIHVRIAQPGGQESLNVASAAAILLHAAANA